MGGHDDVLSNIKRWKLEDCYIEKQLLLAVLGYFQKRMWAI